MIRGKLNIVIDGQWGSTGKGKFCAWLAKNNNIDVSICDFQTNAGHTVVDDNMTSIVFQQLPASAINNETELLISPAATITVSKLLEEIEIHKAWDRLTINPLATVITKSNIEFEQKNLKRIASTLKGCGAATGMKIMRHPDVVLAQDVDELKHFIGDTTEKLQTYIKAGATCLMETAQGFDLSVNHGYKYPYVTSRDVTTSISINNAGIPPQLVGDVYGCLRTFPIRVGNHIEDGNLVGTSGPIYRDQIEITWDGLKEKSKSEFNIEEKTTVTKKIRRVFTFSELQLKKFINMCAPTKIFLNFINHVNAVDYKKRTWSELSVESRSFVLSIVSACNRSWYPAIPVPKVGYLGTGECTSDMVCI